jgi:hypothetical protein
VSPQSTKGGGVVRGELTRGPHAGHDAHARLRAWRCTALRQVGRAASAPPRSVCTVVLAGIHLCGASCLLDVTLHCIIIEAPWLVNSGHGASLRCACHESEHKPTAGVGDRSHKYHCVTPVTRGVRQVMVTEYWRGPPRHCPHRCDDIVRARPHPRPGQTTAACVPSKHQSKHGLMGGATISDCET